MNLGLAIDQVIIQQALPVVQQEGTCCQVEEVAGFWTDLTADQVFLVIDYLARESQVCLTLDADRA